VQPRVANPLHEEPDARIEHVRICGSPGRETSRGHPTCKVSTKSFRRTWNTLAIRQGLDRALIQANTGHSTDAMTDHYARFRTEHRAEAQQRVVGFLDRPVPGPTDRRP